MYESYWQLEQKPFDHTLDPRFYYPSETHQGALLKLRYAVESRRGAALVAGPSGCGKTLLVQLLKRNLAEQMLPFVHLVFPQMQSHELLAYLATELGAAAGDEAAPAIHTTVRRIQHKLTENVQRGRHAVVVMDEAHLLQDIRTFEAMRLLLNFEGGTEPAMTLILVGQPGLLPMVDRMPGLEERLAVKCLLRPLSMEETISYITHRLTAAGVKATIFENAGLETLYHLTHGIIRRINRLCDLALLIGYAEERRTIGAEQLESICEELVNVSPE